MSTPSQLKLHDVSIGYGNTAFLASLNLELYQGDFLGIVGPNGAGKSTLLRVMLRIQKPLAGSVWTAPSLKIGYVPQRSELDPIFPLSTLEVVNPGVGGKKSKLKTGALSAMEKLGITHLASVPFRELSGGQQQRVLMARALAIEPDVLILDEPTAGMDLPSERSLVDFLSDLNKNGGLTVVFVAHQIALVTGTASRIALINKDRGIFMVESARDLLCDEKLSEIYNFPITIDRCDGQICVHAGTPQPDSKTGRAR